MVPERSVLGSLLLNIFSNCLGNGTENLLNLQKTLRATYLRTGLESRNILANWSNGLKNVGQRSKTTTKFTFQK